MQRFNYIGAEVVYKKAQMIDPDCNKACNLGLCLIKQGRMDEARSVLEDVLQGKLPCGNEDPKARQRAEELLLEIGLTPEQTPSPDLLGLGLDDEFLNGIDRMMKVWARSRSKRLPVFEEISQFRDQLTY